MRSFSYLWLICFVLSVFITVSCQTSDSDTNSDGDADFEQGNEAIDGDLYADGDTGETESELDTEIIETDETELESDGDIEVTELETDNDGDLDFEDVEIDLDNPETEQEFSELDSSELDTVEVDSSDVFDSFDNEDVEEDIYPECTENIICELRNRFCYIIDNEEVCGDCFENFHADGSTCYEDEECYLNACSIFGTCKVEEGLVVCKCEDGYAGDKCEDCDREAGYRWNIGKTECQHRPCAEYPCDEDNNQYCYLYVECRCTNDTHWSSDGITCTDHICDPNRCLDVEHSTGLCTEFKEATDKISGNYICECEPNYLWDYDNNNCILDCDNQCFEVGKRECSWGEVRLCETKNDDCAEWVFIEDCVTGVCQNDEYCVVCDPECSLSDIECNDNTLVTCEKNEWGCLVVVSENCELGCGEDACLTELCGSGEVEGREYCDSDSISCASICSDYSEGIANCNNTCSTYDTSTCIQPTVESNFVPITAGSFDKGSSQMFSEGSKWTTTLTNDFEMQNLKVTQQDYQDLMGYNPSVFLECGLTCPVENISYFDAIHYANKLSVQQELAPCIAFDSIECVDGTNVDNEAECLSKGGIYNAVISLAESDSIYACEGYRLPTEAEWEYAARGGSTSYFYNGRPKAGENPDSYMSIEALDLISWYGANSIVSYDGNPVCADFLETPGVTCGTHPVGLKQPNEYCLYDITGNTLEWTYDLYDIHFNPLPPNPVFDPANIVFGDDNSDTIVIRGCAWIAKGSFCSTSNREVNIHPMYRLSYIGFRLVRTLATGE